jgi:hypothetical protein
MPFTSYAELQGELALWTNRRDLTAQIPSFIALAEADLASRLRDRRMVQTVTAPPDCGSIALPTEFIEALRVSMVGQDTPLRVLSLSEINKHRYEAHDAARFYAIRGRVLDIRPVPAPPADPPVPDQPDPLVELVYYARPLALSDANPVNWMLLEEPELYLHAALMKAAPYMVDDERIATWRSLYGDTLDRLNGSSRIAVVSGGPLVRGRRGFG